MGELVNLGIANQTPIWAQTDTSKQPTIKVEAPKQPIYIVDPNQYSAPKGIESVRGNKEKEVLIQPKIQPKIETKIETKSKKPSWWQKQTKTAKTIYVSAGVLAVGLIGYYAYKKFSKN